MSVIVRDVNKKHFDVFCKGSPEKIAELSNPESCIQNDINHYNL
jgi:magnesium-transporting ATPase (P-type)